MEKYIVSPSPHIHTERSTHSIMLDVILALTPAAVVSIVFYGWNALLLYALSIIFCVALEWAITKWLLRKPSTVGDLSAVVTGMLLAMNLPSSSPWWITLVGAIIAIGVAKMTFGGLGQNVFNPAITARVFLLISFPQQMTDWSPTPGFIHTDAVSGATLLGRYSEGGMKAIESMDTSLFFNIGGSVGEISALALIVGFIYLLIRKDVKLWIPASILITVAIISGIFNLVDPTRFTGPAFNLLTGGMLLGSLFMATDYVTSPMSAKGGIVYGFGIGLIVMMIRYFGAYPEGMSFAILLMNMTVPLINGKFHQKKYGRA